jgi:hypothetical protein
MIRMRIPRDFFLSPPSIIKLKIPTDALYDRISLLVEFVNSNVFTVRHGVIN